MSHGKTEGFYITHYYTHQFLLSFGEVNVVPLPGLLLRVECRRGRRRPLGEARRVPCPFLRREVRLEDLREFSWGWWTAVSRRRRGRGPPPRARRHGDPPPRGRSRWRTALNDSFVKANVKFASPKTAADARLHAIPNPAVGACARRGAAPSRLSRADERRSPTWPALLGDYLRYSRFMRGLGLSWPSASRDAALLLRVRRREQVRRGRAMVDV